MVRELIIVIDVEGMFYELCAKHGIVPQTVPSGKLIPLWRAFVDEQKERTTKLWEKRINRFLDKQRGNK